MSLVVRSLFFGDGVLEVVYMDTAADVRATGQLVKTHTIQIDTARGDYGSEMDELEAATLAILRDALEDFDSAPRVIPGSEQPSLPDEDGDDEQ